jgi:hypothetical protein
MKLKELFEAPAARYSEPQSPSFISKIKRAMNPTGEGRQKLSAKTDALVKKWSDYRGQTNAIPNAANIEHWVKKSLGLDDPNIWAQTIEEFSEENPSAGQKYKDQSRLDSKDISKFLNKLVQIRLMNPDVPLWTHRHTDAQASTAAQSTQPLNNKKNQTTTQTTSDEENTGLPQHPVYAQTGIHMQPKAAETPTHAATTENPPAAKPDPITKANNPMINPEPVNPNKPATLKPDDKNAVDWEKVRSRFPKKPVTNNKSN